MNKQEALDKKAENAREMGLDYEPAALEAKDEPVIDQSAAKRIATALGWEPKRRPLTDEEMDAVINGCPKYHGRFSTKDPDGKLNYYELVRAVEAAHGIKGEA
jgi:hypothetical protein